MFSVVEVNILCAAVKIIFFCKIADYYIWKNCRSNYQPQVAYFWRKKSCIIANTQFWATFHLKSCRLVSCGHAELRICSCRATISLQGCWFEVVDCWKNCDCRYADNFIKKLLICSFGSGCGHKKNKRMQTSDRRCSVRYLIGVNIPPMCGRCT